jgi:hypothetical protein
MVVSSGIAVFFQSQFRAVKWSCSNELILPMIRLCQVVLHNFVSASSNSSAISTKAWLRGFQSVLKEMINGFSTYLKAIADSSVDLVWKANVIQAIVRIASLLKDAGLSGEVIIIFCDLLPLEEYPKAPDASFQEADLRDVDYLTSNQLQPPKTSYDLLFEIVCASDSCADQVVCWTLRYIYVNGASDLVSGAWLRWVEKHKSPAFSPETDAMLSKTVSLINRLNSIDPFEFKKSAKRGHEGQENKPSKRIK